MSRSSRQDLLVKVATLYHKQGQTQDEIASSVNVSRQTVSRLLKEAEEVGIVTFEIRDPSGQVKELGARVRDRFNLANATVVDVSGLDVERALTETTRVAALACYDRIAASSVIGMLWGPTVLHFSHALPRGRHPELTIAQMGGMIPTIPGRNAIDPAVTAAADSLGAKADLIAAPLFVDTPVIRDAIMSDSRIAAALENARRADMYIFSVGKAALDGGLYQSGYVTTTEIEKLEREEAVGELCGLFYSITGESCGSELESRTIALTRDEIRSHSPARADRSQLPARHPQLQAPLRAGTRPRCSSIPSLQRRSWNSRNPTPLATWTCTAQPARRPSTTGTGR